MESTQPLPEYSAPVYEAPAESEQKLVPINVGGELFYFEPILFEQERICHSNLMSALTAFTSRQATVGFQGSSEIFERYVQGYIRTGRLPDMAEVEKNGHKAGLQQLARNLGLDYLKTATEKPALGDLPKWLSASRPARVQAPMRDPRSDDPIDIRLLTLTGKTIEISIRPDQTVYQLKLAIQRTEGYPPDMGRLIFDRNQLHDDRTLRSYGIRQDSVLHLVLKVSGD